MRPAFRNFVFVICLLSIISFSCKKEQKDPLEYDTQTTQDNALAEGVFSDVNNIVNQAMISGTAGLITYRTIEDNTSILSGCATVTVTPNGAGGTISVDFGSANCYCRDFKYRRGIINFTYTGAYTDSGTVITTTFDNYYVGKDSTYMFKVNGTKTVQCLGMNADSAFVYSVNVNGSMVDANSRTMSWTSSRTRKWIAGYATTGINSWSDDVYTISGTSSGTNFEGNAFTAAITTPLVIDYSCRYIAKGVIELTPSGKPTRSIDYGNGTCDDDATITVNGISFQVKLR